MVHGHQIGDHLRAIIVQLVLFGRGERLQVTCHLPVVRRDEDEPFALRSLLEFEYTLYCFSILRIAAEAETGFSRIGDESAAFEVGNKSS